MNASYARPVVFALLWGALLLAWMPSGAAAQDSQVLMPDQSAAKANQIMQQAIEALGGTAYLNVHDATCTGRVGTFDHAGEMSGEGKIIDYSIPPFKERTESLPKRNQIDVFNGDAGWNLDRGGMTEEPKSQLDDFQDTVKKDLDNILRHRIHEPGMVIRYDGADIVDLKQVDWVRLIDSDNRTIRIAFDRSTRLPIRKTVESRDPKTRLVTTEQEIYSLYFPFDDVQTAKQLERDRNGMKVFQLFMDKCDYNTGLADSLFTRQSLEEWYAKLPNRDKYHDKKGKNNKDSKDKKDDSDSSSDSPTPHN